MAKYNIIVAEKLQYTEAVIWILVFFLNHNTQYFYLFVSNISNS